MQEKVMRLIKEGSIVIPRILLCNYKSLNMNENDLVILMYIMNMKDLEFNPAIIGKDMNMTLPEVMENIDHLINLNIIKLESKKVNNIRKEEINLDNLYEKLLYLVINEETKDKLETDIFSTFEKEFGRTLAPMEYEIINSWLDTGYEKELVIAALKEAVYNGVFKLNYIDKILYEWSKKGIKNNKDIELDKEKFTKKKEEKKELYDYNWLEEE